jgi:hypothetical protein
VYVKIGLILRRMKQGGLKQMARKVRSDKTVGKLEKDLGLPPGTVRNKDGRDIRSDKTVGKIRKEQGKK